MSGSIREQERAFPARAEPPHLGERAGWVPPELPLCVYVCVQESHLLLDQCERPGLDCPAEAQRHYVVDVLNLAEAAQSQFTRAAFEGSTHYVLVSVAAPGCSSGSNARSVWLESVRQAAGTRHTDVLPWCCAGGRLVCGAAGRHHALAEGCRFNEGPHLAGYCHAPT